jgi:hypothetical protein
MDAQPGQRGPALIPADSTAQQQLVATALSELREEHHFGRRILPGDRIASLDKLARGGALTTLEPLLPVLFNLDGKPLTLRDHYPFDQLYRLSLPDAVVYRTARQTGKSSSIASHGIAMSVCLPNFKTLFVTPLYEQIRRFSSNYVRPLVERSPVRALMTGVHTDKSVLQRSFKNDSLMIFSFALLDAERLRGIAADKLCFDEVQDIDPSHIPIAREAMSHSQYGLTFFTGTPKSLENTIEGLFRSSSQAEWWIPCFRCTTFGHPTWNIPSLEHHLLRMIGPYREDISEESPGTICYKCGRPINPRFGRWVHAYPEKRWELAGYHVPQLILPLHFASPKKWRELTLKQQGWGNMSQSKFLNEVLGEGTDEGTKLVSETDLKHASILPWRNDPRRPHPEVLQRLGNYQHRCLAIDWGGGGEKGVSFTVLALLGMRPDGEIHCLWGKRLLTSADHYAEAVECLHWFNNFRCEFIAHDYTGAGTVRETVLVQAGMDIGRIFAVRLARTASQALMVAHEPSLMNHRHFFSLDKARSLLYTCQAIKQRQLQFFEYDFENRDNAGLIADFLALIEEKVETRLAGDVYTITRNAFLSDDFAQSVNIGVHSLWHVTQSYPDFVRSSTRFNMSSNQFEAAGHAGFGFREDAQLGGFFEIP